jgi:hypothetical protein
MKTKRLLSCFILLAVGFGLVFLPYQVVRADTGPKPSMKFKFVYEVSPAPAIVSATLLECSDPNCAIAAPLREMGPQGFSCQEGGCSSLAYVYSEYHRLSIEFSDGRQRESNSFTKNHFEAYYTVHVRESSLLVEEMGGRAKLTNMVGSFIGYFFSALMQEYFNRGLPVTLIVELFVGLIYVILRKRPWVPVLLTILLMNLVTQPILWFVVKEMRLTACAFTYVLELIVCLVEAWILYLVLRKSVNFTEILLLSFVMNLASFGVGLLLPF